MIPLTVTVKRTAPRKQRSDLKQAQKAAWFKGAVWFHVHKSDERFTQRHASRAGYAKRKKRYEQRKFKLYGHRRPLEYSGRTRFLSRTANITSTSVGARVRYPNLRGLNRRHPKSDINMAQEFRTLLPEETQDVAAVLDAEIDKEFKHLRK